MSLYKCDHVMKCQGDDVFLLREKGFFFFFFLLNCGDEVNPWVFCYEE